MNEFIYFKSVPGRLVTRFGTRTLIGAEIIGSKVEREKRLPMTQTDIKWSDEPVAIPMSEYSRYRREYNRCVREGSLIEVQAPVSEAPKASKSKVSKE